AGVDEQVPTRQDEAGRDGQGQEGEEQGERAAPDARETGQGRGGHHHHEKLEEHSGETRGREGSFWSGVEEIAQEGDGDGEEHQQHHRRPFASRSAGTDTRWPEKREANSLDEWIPRAQCGGASLPVWTFFGRRGRRWLAEEHRAWR